MESVLRQNGYPTRFLDKIIGKFLDKSLQKRIMTTTVLKKTLLLTLPGFTFHTKNNKLFKDHSPFGKLEVIHGSTQRISFCFRHKNPTPCSFLSSVIYRYKCPKYNSTQFNIQILEERVEIHLHMTALTGKSLKAIQSHCTKNEVSH